MIEIMTTVHPRLFINQEQIEALKVVERSDPFFAELTKELIKKANSLMKQDVVLFKITGPRMLSNCQEIRSRVTTLAMAYLLTNDIKFAERAKNELFSAVCYPHWNKDHFLDTAELITAFAIGFDWLFNALSSNELELIKQALINKGIKEGLNEHKKNIWWASHKYNWNQVCNGGLIIGALAIADEEPQLFEDVFEATVNYLPIAFNSYGKDGGWEAGPDYWQYTTLFSALLIDALKTVTENDFGLSMTPGFDKTGFFPIYVAGARDKLFNFADADETYNPLPVLFWLGKQFHNDAFISENHRLLRTAINNNANFDAFNLIWYQPEKEDAVQLPLNKLFSDINLGVFRSDHATDATYMAFKGGFNQADHAHLDLGSFVLDIDGVRWVADLGRDNYDLPNYFNLSEGGGRWDYFRLSTKSHNTLVLNNDNQRAAAKAEIISFDEKENDLSADINLSAAYKPHADSVIRTIRMVNGTEIIISDIIEWSGLKKSAQWQILTDASVQLAGNTAILEKEGKKLIAKIVQPANAFFELISAEQKEPEMKNSGYKQLIIQIEETEKTTKIEVIFNRS